MDEKNYELIVNMFGVKLSQVLQEQIKANTLPKKDTPEGTYREQPVLLIAGGVKEVSFDDTKPLYIIFINPSASPIYVGTNTNVSTTNYDYTIAAGKRFQCVFGRGISAINVFCAAAVTVRIASYEARIDPVAFALANQ